MQFLGLNQCRKKTSFQTGDKNVHKTLAGAEQSSVETKVSVEALCDSRSLLKICTRELFLGGSLCVCPTWHDDWWEKGWDMKFSVGMTCTQLPERPVEKWHTATQRDMLSISRVTKMFSLELLKCTLNYTLLPLKYTWMYKHVFLPLLHIRRIKSSIHLWLTKTISIKKIIKPYICISVVYRCFTRRHWVVCCRGKQAGVHLTKSDAEHSRDWRSWFKKPNFHVKVSKIGNVNQCSRI